MATIYKNNFSSGWTPSDDALNGDPNGLLRMDNLKLDENGAVTLTKGTSLVNTSGLFPSRVHSIYSKYFNGHLWRFVGLGDGSVWADYGGFDLTSFGTTAVKLINGGSASKAAMCAAYNSILVCSGSQKYKWCPSVALTVPFQLGVGKPTVGPTLTANAPPTVDVTGTVASEWGSDEGTFSTISGNTQVQVVADATTFRGSAKATYGSTKNTLTLSSSSGGTANDLFNFLFNISDSSALYSVTVEFLLDSGHNNYYIYTWANSATYKVPRPIYTISGRPISQTPSTNVITNAFSSGASQWNSLTCKRGDFTRVGTDQTKSWANVYGVRVSYVATSAITCQWYNFSFNGGTIGPLDGYYEYCQVNQNTQVGYTAQSARGVITTVEAHQTSVHITPQASTTGDIQANQWAIYRRGGKLEVFYQVKTGGPTATAFDDTMSDTDAELLGIKLNENLAAVKDISDDIIKIIGGHFNRYIYFTFKNIYISEINNPDSYDQAKGVISPFNTQAEFFLWAEKVSNSTIIVASTENFYELSGTFNPLADGTIDAILRPLGTKNPAINDASVVDSGIIYYCASDGWRTLDGNGSNPLSLSLQKLFKKEDRYGIKQVRINGGNQDIFAVGVSKNELYTVQVLSDGSRVCWVYDILRKYWYTYKTAIGGYLAPLCLYTEESGELLGGFQDAGNYNLYILNTGNLTGGTTKQDINLLTHITNNGQPFNRKDSYTLKLDIDTGGDPVDVALYKDESLVSTDLGFTAANGITELPIDIFDKIAQAKALQLQITGTVGIFKFRSWAVEHDVRPVQQTTLRTQPTNFGIAGRKRMNDFPFTVDTIGNVVDVTPIADGVQLTGSKLTITTADKLTSNLRFSPDIIANDFNLLIRTRQSPTTILTQYFEFYELIKPQTLELFPDQINYLTIPYSNLGLAGKKRFRVIPFRINTNGRLATFTPSIDGVPGPPLTFSTNYIQTVFYYYTTDVFGIDLGVTISGDRFEFYGLLDLPGVPSWVELLPVGKLFDQVGPLDMVKYGTLKGFRTRLLAEDSVVNLNFFMDDVSLYTTALPVTPGLDKAYDVPWVPKNIYGGVMRVELSSPLPMHRWDFLVRVKKTGAETEDTWIPMQ